jgi:hypothetical protein
MADARVPRDALDDGDAVDTGNPFKNEFLRLLRLLTPLDNMIRNKITGRFPILIPLDTLRARKLSILSKMEDILKNDDAPSDLKEYIEPFLETEMEEIQNLESYAEQMAQSQGQPQAQPLEQDDDDRTISDAESTDIEEEASAEASTEPNIRGSGIMASYSHRIQMALAQARSRAS